MSALHRMLIDMYSCTHVLTARASAAYPLQAGPAFAQSEGSQEGCRVLKLGGVSPLLLLSCNTLVQMWCTACLCYWLPDISAGVCRGAGEGKLTLLRSRYLPPVMPVLR